MSALKERTYEALPANAQSIRIEHKDGSWVNLLRSTMGLGGYDFEAYSQSSDPIGRGTVGLSFISQFLSADDKLWVDGERYKLPSAGSLERKAANGRTKGNGRRAKTTRTRADMSTKIKTPETPANRQTSRNN